MYLTIKAYSQEVFKKFYDLYGTNTQQKDNVIYDQVMVDTLEITFYNNLTIMFKGTINKNVEDNIDILLDKKLYVGTDEVGVGEGVGPIIAGAIKFKSLKDKKKVLMSGIKDSKKLDHKDVMNLAKIIKQHSTGQIRILPPTEFNNLYKRIPNVKKINAIMQNELLKQFDSKDVKVTDEFVNIKKFMEYLNDENIEMFMGKFILTPKAEEKYLEVACAAIVAKAAYNDWMIKYTDKYNIPLTLGKKLQAQQLYLDWRSGKVNIPNENELVKKWNK